MNMTQIARLIPLAKVKKKLSKMDYLDKILGE
jgi:hypothetical protein